jgi:hypothetical protein
VLPALLVEGYAATLIGLPPGSRDPVLLATWIVVPAVIPAGALAWATASGAAALRRAEAGTPVLRAALASLRRLGLPAVIGLLLLALLLAPVVHHGFAAMDQDQVKMLQQGEVHYWGIGTGHLAPGNGRLQAAGDR